MLCFVGPRLVSSPGVGPLRTGVPLPDGLRRVARVTGSASREKPLPSLSLLAPGVREGPVDLMGKSSRGPGSTFPWLTVVR